MLSTSLPLKNVSFDANRIEAPTLPKWQLYKNGSELPQR